MALQNQVNIYSVDTSAFYNDIEFKIHKHMSKLYRFRKELAKRKSKLKDIEENKKLKQKINKYILSTNARIKRYKEKLRIEFNKDNGIRNLRNDMLNKYNIISIFESATTRVSEIEIDSLSEDIIVVQAYFFEILEDIVLNGFILNNEKYICFTASAGQIRTKKTVFIREILWNEIKNALTCGLSIEDINRHGGVNINKYLAYLALNNSATDLWRDFDIRKTIVVDDMETPVNGMVDFIDDKTYEIKRQIMNIVITHTDGCGMILPSKSKKNFMVRLPWVKGLLSPYNFRKYIKELNEKDPSTNHGIIKDIYGKEHDILKENIEVIFTKSQFKMYKYYDSWDQYINNFIKYKCQAGKCNEEEDEFAEAKLNYQMLQTLTSLTDNELKKVCFETKKNILNIGSDRKTMLRVLGVTPSNSNKNYLQQALEIYPELLRDTYSKEILKQVKKSLVKNGRAAKLDTNGKYTFLIPDLYAFCEFLFLGDKEPKGLLQNGQVYCKLFKDEPKLACLRSPHLYREWAIRDNIIDEEKEKWFITDGIYTSCHDFISRILQFDNDGDRSLVCADKTLIQCAERDMKDIVPLYYEMKKAGAEIINEQSIFNGLKAAYTGGNIGIYSNNISKIWNSNNVNLDVIKLLCMENNFVIDYAKTLYKPARPNKEKELIISYTKSRLPHFFKYAKDKSESQIERVSNSVVNRLEKIIPDKNINFNAANLGKFDYKMLMYNKSTKIDEEIIKKYKKLDLRKHFMINIQDEEISNIVYLYKDIRKQLLEINNNPKYVTDVLIAYLYEFKKSNFKTTLWECFGDIIVDNLKENIKNKLDNTILCECCGKRIEITGNKTKYCDECAKKIEKENWAERKRKQRKREKCHEIETE